MKFSIIIFFLLSLIFLGCGSEPSIEEQMDPKTTACYAAIGGSDTAWLRIDTSHAQVLGLFEINYPKKKQRYLGQFKGVKRGDTIKGHWDFKVNNIDKWHRNPVSFLKRNDNLLMGVGKIIMVWGSGHFDEKVPVDYDKGKFVFELATCKN